jgi:hypothetical protein
MVGSRIRHILNKIPTGSIMVGDREIATSIRTQNEHWKRLDVVLEPQKALLHKTLMYNAHMINPRTGEIMLRQVLLG